MIPEDACKLEADARTVSTFWQGMVSGGILIAAVGLGVLRDHGWMAGVRRRRRS